MRKRSSITRHILRKSWKLRSSINSAGSNGRKAIYLHEIERRIRENGGPGPYDSPYVEMDLKDLVGRAVNGLIESRRKVVQLYLLNMSIEEISLYFHWSKDKTRNLLYRGLCDLKKILKEKNIDYEHQP